MALMIFAGAVSASDENTGVLTQDAGEINEINTDEILTVEQGSAEGDFGLKEPQNQSDLSQKKSLNLLGSADSTTLLGAGETGTFSQLVTEIGSGGNIVLSKKLYTYDSGSRIQITTNSVIDGNGAVIDMAGSNIQVFDLQKATTFKNLTIKM